MNREEKQVSNYLKRYRMMLGFTQQQVARKLGIESTSIISRWERGIAYPDLKNLLKLSVIYKTLIDQLYFELRKSLKVEMCIIDISKQSEIRPP